ncbi:MAG: metal-dependent transcriptional regulator [Oscillospiraceae bacterium]|jgi:Mn-dependent DtxR family transcriptional regulator|nr:metal-dependent transcriptional regulator [Oscillospiraceae bacterium]
MANVHGNLPALPEGLTPSGESYLDVIHELSHRDEMVRSVDVAERLGVSKVSVNKALSVLKQAGLVEQQPYQSIRLTEAGVAMAHRVTWRHQVWYAFFAKALGIPETEADAQACLTEHVVGDETVRRLEAYLLAQGMDPKR